MTGVTWDILLPTLPHRHDQMCALLAEINRQHEPGLGMILYRDNLQRAGNASYGKWQDLQEMSRADYTSFIADDDWIAPDFVSRIMDALAQDPDYVGFAVKYTVDGNRAMPVEHSLRHRGWANSPELLTRDICHQNPIRRELALLATWRTGIHHADRQFAGDLRATGKVRTEVWIPDPVFWYQETPDTWTRRHVRGEMWAPLPQDEIKPVPEYPWLTVRDEA
ncbi:MAG TPA: hypothetical protein VMV92_05390 [Streptosporangiaceae bacterium]|nr:hypothetical protein [Streptosporangiaceae bacterium]